MQHVIEALAIILVLFTVVIVHESGHFVAGKLSGIRVDEFAVGFGPKLLSRKFGETLYSLRVLPLGGFVRLAGMLGLPGEADAGERNFYRASIPRRLVTIVAGVAFNFIFAGICFTAVDLAPTSSFVAANGPAALGGLHNGDSILSIDGRQIRHDTPSDATADLHAATETSQGRPMHVVYHASDGSTRTTTVAPWLVVLNPNPGPLPTGQLHITAVGGSPVGTGDPAALLAGGGQTTISGHMLKQDWSAGTPFDNAVITGVKDGYSATSAPVAAWKMGVAPDLDGKPFPEAVGDGFARIPGFFHDTFVGIVQLSNGTIPGGLTGPNGFTGPVGIAEQTVNATNNGWLGQGGLVWWIGFISMNLGLVNILPIPFLDGGKLMFILIEAVRRKRLDPRHEAIASAVGLALVVLFVIYVTIGDVSRSQ
jgi:regulator of sigma E protease